MLPSLRLARLTRRRTLAAFFSNSSSRESPRVAVVLSGCGVFDGSEVHEAAAVLAHLTRGGAEPQCFAPDIHQMHVVDHVKGQPSEKERRNVMAESARIARGKIQPLSDLRVSKLDAVVFPGGFGAAKNLSDFATNGPNCKVHPEVERILKEFHAAKKPIALCCIAPVLAARVLPGVTVTLGKPDDGSGKWPYSGAIEAAQAMGAKTQNKGVEEVCVDSSNRVVTTPAFMYEGHFHEVHDGIGKMVNAMLKML